MSKPTVLSSKIAYSFKYLSMVEEQLVLPTGQTTNHMTVQHPGAIVILPITDEGHILFIRQYRHSIGDMLLELPAGALNHGENPLESAQRELQEETGFAARDIVPLGIAFPVPGFCSEVQHFFVARGLFESRLPADDDEQIELAPMTVAEVEAHIKGGTLPDSKSVALFIRARLNGFI
jgi:ADP-ribose pyrophosphatase